MASHSDFLKRYWKNILLVPASIVITFGLVQKFILPYDFLKHFGYSPDTIPAYQTVDADLDFRRIQSTLRGANPLGAYLVLIIPALILVLRKSRNLLIVGLVAAFIVLFFSYSRSAWVGIIIATGLLAFWPLAKRPAWRWLLAASTVVLVVGIGSVYLTHSSQSVQDTLFHTSSTSTSSKSSNAERLEAMENGVLDVWHQPLGRGPGTAGPASLRNDNRPRIAENYFLQIGQEVGVIGMMLFMAINVLVARQLWRRRAEVLALVLLASLAGITFVNLVSHAWTDDTLAYLWWGLAGVVIATPAAVSKKQKATTKSNLSNLNT